MRGLAALAGIAISLVVILQFILPAILEGHSPVLVAVLGSAAIAYIALYLAHGFNVLTTVALLGTLAALALTVAFSAIFTALCHFSGFATEEALVLGQLAQGVDITGLFLAGVVIGALGAARRRHGDPSSRDRGATRGRPAYEDEAVVSIGTPDRTRPHRINDKHTRPGIRGCRASVAVVAGAQFAIARHRRE